MSEDTSPTTNPDPTQLTAIAIPVIQAIGYLAKEVLATPWASFVACRFNLGSVTVGVRNPKGGRVDVGQLSLDPYASYDPRNSEAILPLTLSLVQPLFDLVDIIWEGFIANGDVPLGYSIHAPSPATNAVPLEEAEIDNSVAATRAKYLELCEAEPYVVATIDPQVIHPKLEVNFVTWEHPDPANPEIPVSIPAPLYRHYLAMLNQNSENWRRIGILEGKPTQITEEVADQLRQRRSENQQAIETALSRIANMTASN